MFPWVSKLVADLKAGCPLVIDHWCWTYSFRHSYSSLIVSLRRSWETLWFAASKNFYKEGLCWRSRCGWVGLAELSRVSLGYGFGRGRADSGWSLGLGLVRVELLSGGFVGLGISPRLDGG